MISCLLKKIPDVNEETVFSTIAKHKCFKKRKFHAYRGFTFMLNHKILIHQFGIQSRVLANCNEPIQLVLSDAVSQTKIASLSFIYNTGGNESEYRLYKFLNFYF